MLLSNTYEMTASFFLQLYDSADQFHLWYTLPWAFNELVQIPIPDKSISELEVLQPSHSSTILSSSIMFPDNIEQLQLFCCDRNIDLKLPSLHHLTVISSLDALHRCSSISMNIQSINIVLRQRDVQYTTGNWTALHSLRSLPYVRSLRVVMYELHMSADDPSCQIIAETAMWFVDFAFSFRRCDCFPDLDNKSAFERCCSFIEELRQRIIALSGNQKLQCSVEKDGCGLIVWREQRHHD
jgi:hypothetical protein